MDFVEEAKQTLSGGFHEELVKPIDVVMVISQAIKALNELDKLKKTIFYGKNYDPNWEGVELRNTEYSDLKGFGSISNMLNNVSQDRKQAENIFHGIIGSATETGEMLEALAKSLGGHKFDIVNLKEEVGDVKWYLAILADNGGFKWGEDEKKVIEKLRERYPNKFTEYDALNRNLEAERKILEK